MVNGVSNPYKHTISDIQSFKQTISRRASLNAGGLNQAVSNLVDAFASSSGQFGTTCADAIVNAARDNPEESLYKVASTFVNALKEKGLIGEDGKFVKNGNNPGATSMLTVKQAASNLAVKQQLRAAELKEQFTQRVITANTQKPATAAETMAAINTAKQTQAGTPAYSKAFTDLVNVIRRGGNEMIQTLQNDLKSELAQSISSKGASSPTGENFESKYLQASQNLETLRGAAPRQNLHVTKAKSSIGMAAQFHANSRAKHQTGRFHESDLPQMNGEGRKPDLHANATKGMATFAMREAAFAGKLVRGAQRAGKDTESSNPTHDSKLIGEYISQSGQDAFHGVISLIASTDGHFQGLVDSTANSIAVASNENSGFVVTMTSTMNPSKVPVDINRAA